MSDPNIGAGNVEIVLDGETYVLKPTLKAALTLTNVQGGLPALIQRCINLEINAIVEVISQGLGVTSKDLPERVWRTGLFTLSARCIRFLNILANGGRPLDAEDDKEGGAPLEQTS